MYEKGEELTELKVKTDKVCIKQRDKPQTRKQYMKIYAHQRNTLQDS